jgi:electron transfer flavoprotein alpha subunit
MSVLVYTESEGGKFKKIAFEVVSYARNLADQLNTSVTVLSINGKDLRGLGTYGASRVVNINHDALQSFNAEVYAAVISEVARKENATVVILSSSADSKYMAPSLAVELDAGYVPNVVGLPVNTNPFTVKSNVFSNKAFAMTEIQSDIKILGLAKNSFGLKEHETNITEENFNPTVDGVGAGIEVLSTDLTSDKVSIADADVVVSGGRGMKGPENWGMLEELAEILGAATACSKPVSDMGWRPHSEHVGQTGKPVSSNVYIAIGISGAIQHLAGVNASKVKVVINNDPEAPFFKAADYGIVGDAFEIIPELNEKLKAFKAQNA